MTSDQLTALIRQSILQALNDCRGYLVPEPALIAQIQAMVAPPPTQKEVETQLKWLEAEGYIAGIRPELGGPVKWKITDKGRASL